MPSIINATTTAGVAVTGDNSGALALQTNNGTTAVTIDTSQNVGIGTTSPSFKTEIVGGATTVETTLLLVRSNAGGIGTGTTIALSNSTNPVAGSGRVELAGLRDTASGSSFAVRTADSGGTVTERMRITSGGNLTIGETTSDYRLNAVGSASQKGFRIRSGGNGGVTILDVADTNGNSGMLLQANGDFILASSYAQKASGTTWANPSDSRIKENVVDYTKGLNELAQINVKTWNYNGKAKTVAGTKGLGVIADEIMQVLPETVDTYKAKLNDDDETESDIKRFDATEITWLLVNAVKELNAKVEAQAVRIAELEGAK